MARREYGVGVLSGLCRRLRASLDLAEAMPRVVSEVADLLDAERCVLLLDRGGRVMETVAACRDGDAGGRDGDGAAGGGQGEADPSRTVIERVRRKLQPVLADDLTADARFGAAESVRATDPRSVICVPLLAGGRFMGALYADNRLARGVFDREDLAFLEAAGDVVALVLANARAHTRFIEAARLSESFLLDLDPESLLGRALARVVEITRAGTGALLLRDGTGGGDPAVRATRQRDGEPPAGDIGGRISAHAVRRVMETGRPLLTDNATLDPDDSLAYSARTKNLLSILCVPIRAWGETRGAIYLENAVAEGVFDEEDARLALVVADQAGMALENARLHGVERATVTALANAIEARDSGTSSHVQRVTTLAVAVGRRMGLSDKQIADLERAAILHDVGKIGVPDSVLLKPGRLDPPEVEIMKRHPDLGADIVRPIGLSPAALDGIRAHQESFNGRGYPRGLAGADIPLFGRILAVVDTYDAMVSDRPYRKGSPPEQALAEIRRCAGTQFDPAVAAAFLEIREAQV
ncbi:MAG: GAF domain-containing protein [Deltaproteobacteria bacterium]|nr:GAF domain-containing protein [Deltaproteobacteria bacterium]